MSQATFQIGSSIGPYILVRPLAKGGMGQIFEALEPSLDRRVAVKFVRDALREDPAFVQRFIREAKTLAKISHPNVISVFSIGEIAGTHYIAMELVDGRNLRQFLSSLEYLMGDLYLILQETAAGLRAVHEKEVLHRDIKLSNVMVTKEGKVKIGDFGLAKSQEDPGSDITRTGLLIGTIQYMAPEVINGETFTQVADIFALGMLFFEVLCGFNPFLTKSDVETANRIRELQVEFPADVRGEISWELRSLIMAMLAKDPKERIQTMAEVCQRLEADQLVRRGALSGLHWPRGLSLDNAKEVKSWLTEFGCNSAVERAKVLARYLEADRPKGAGGLSLDRAALQECLQRIRNPSPAPALVEVTEGLSDPTSDPIPSLEEIGPSSIKKMPNQEKNHVLALADESVELDSRALAQELRILENAAKKSNDGKIGETPRSLEVTGMNETAERDRAENPVSAQADFNVRSHSKFTFQWPGLRGILLLAVFGIVGGVFFWREKGETFELIECMERASGFPEQIQYEDIPVSPQLSALQGSGFNCDAKYSCWPRSGAGVRFSLTRDPEFPVNSSGEALVDKENALYFFRNSSLRQTQVRSFRRSTAGFVILGLEACNFSSRDASVAPISAQASMAIHSLLHKIRL